MNFKSLLSLAFVATLMVSGSLKAEEPKVMTPHSREMMKPGHTVEAHKQIPYMTSEEVNRMKADQAHRQQSHNKGKAAPLKMNKNAPQNRVTESKGKSTTTHSDTALHRRSHESSPKGRMPQARVHGNVVTTDPAQTAALARNMKILEGIQKYLFSKGCPGCLYSDDPYKNGAALLEIMVACEALCATETCAEYTFSAATPQAGTKVIMPVDPAILLQCFKEGVQENDKALGAIFSEGGVCDNCDLCPTNNLKNACLIVCCTPSDTSRLQGCTGSTTCPSSMSQMPVY